MSKEFINKFSLVGGQPHVFSYVTKRPARLLYRLVKSRTARWNPTRCDPGYRTNYLCFPQVNLDSTSVLWYNWNFHNP